jgi:hypothetical protein
MGLSDLACLAVGARKRGIQPAAARAISADRGKRLMLCEEKVVYLMPLHPD